MGIEGFPTDRGLPYRLTVAPGVEIDTPWLPVCPRCESPDDVYASDPEDEDGSLEKFCAGCLHAWGPGVKPLDGLDENTGLPLVHEFLVTIDDPSDGFVTACAAHAREIARDQGGTLTGETRRAPDGYCPFCPEEAP